MSELANEIWSELKRYVHRNDRGEAAETLVSVLVDNDIDPDDIRAAFKNDTDVRRALTSYLDDHEDDDDDDDLDLDDDDLNDDDDD
jgi:hypothetical protein